VVRKIRIDLGISIEFDSISIHPAARMRQKIKEDVTARIGCICYSIVDGESAADGVLI